MKTPLLSLLIWAALPVVPMAAEKPASGKPVLFVVETAIPNSDRFALRLDINTDHALPRDFIETQSSRLENYRLWQVIHPDEPEVTAHDITPAFLQSVNAGDPNRVYLLLRKGKLLDDNGTYIIEIRNFAGSSPADGGISTRITARFTLAASVIVSDAFHQDKTAAIRSQVPLAVRDNQHIQVTEATYRIENGDVAKEVPDRHEAVVSSAGDGNLVLVELAKPLTPGREHEVAVTLPELGHTGQTIIASGTLHPAGTRDRDDAAKVNLTFAGNAAVHQRAVLTLLGTVAPLRTVYLPGSVWHWDPSLNVDLGLRSTQSANSIVFDSAFRHISRGPNQAAMTPGSNLETYSRWKNTPWYVLGAVEFSAGPRLEADRTFARRNLVAEERFDFKFYKWLHTVEDIRRRIASDLGPEKANLVQNLDQGFELVPYIGTDQGAHLNNEIVTNGTTLQSVLIPRHAILRAFAGLHGKYEFRNIALTLDQQAFYLGSTETIGYVTSSGLGIRRVRGWQPRTTVGLSLTLDPGGHYAFTAQYQNGRLAPDFEYLNRVIVGLRLIY